MKQNGIWQGLGCLFSSEAPFPERDSVRDELVSLIHSFTHWPPWCIKKKQNQKQTNKQNNPQRSRSGFFEINRVCGFQGVFSLEPSFLFVHQIVCSPQASCQISFCTLSGCACEWPREARNRTRERTGIRQGLVWSGWGLEDGG